MKKLLIIVSFIGSIGTLDAMQAGGMAPSATGAEVKGAAKKSNTKQSLVESMETVLTKHPEHVEQIFIFASRSEKCSPAIVSHLLEKFSKDISNECLAEQQSILEKFLLSILSKLGTASRKEKKKWNNVAAASEMLAQEAFRRRKEEQEHERLIGEELGRIAEEEEYAANVMRTGSV